MLLGQLMSEPSKHKTYKIRAPTTTVVVVTRVAGEGEATAFWWNKKKTLKNTHPDRVQ